MGRKIFVTYKYADPKVLSLNLPEHTTVRDYVDALQDLLDSEDHIYKGEEDDTPLDHFKEATIRTHLCDKIFDSSLTIILVSKGMVLAGQPETDQWMPWEISYSLQKKTREGKSSNPNALLAVVLPDDAGRHDYYLVEKSCAHCNSQTLKTSSLFKIMEENMFNIKSPVYSDCANHTINVKSYSGYASYIHSVTWEKFKANPDHYIKVAMDIGANIDAYEMTKRLS